jgi:hypothetical protein
LERENDKNAKLRAVACLGVILQVNESFLIFIEGLSLRNDFVF